jgi:hypothetical protein
MEAPFFSSFSAIAEIFVTAAVLYIVLNNYQGKGFAWRLAAAVCLFEFSVNMLYMISRLRADAASGEATGPMALFAAGHGLLSLIIFVALVVFCFQAYQAWKRGAFYFQERPTLTFVFLFFWTVSVVTGEVLYVVRYLI